MARSIARITAVGATVAAMLALTASPALADEKNRVLSNSHGKMIHHDSVDVFEVCDTKADGYGVSGRLTHRNISLGTVEYAFTIDDGGDAGCDKKAYDVKGYPHYYLMKFWWHGGGSALTTEWFRE